MQNAEIPILLSLFFHLVLFWIFFSCFIFNFSIVMLNTVWISHVSNLISLARVFKFFLLFCNPWLTNTPTGTHFATIVVLWGTMIFLFHQVYRIIFTCPQTTDILITLFWQFRYNVPKLRISEVWSRLFTSISEGVSISFSGYNISFNPNLETCQYIRMVVQDYEVSHPE